MASSGYTLWSVVAGEQPTSAKWNLLGSNDASFNTGVGFNDGIINNRHIALNAMFTGLKTTAGEVSYPASTWTPVGGMTTTVTTTKPNQVVTVFSSFQTYTGGYSKFQYTLDGNSNFVGNLHQYRTATNDTTTGMVLYMDFFTIGTVGAHTIQLQAYAGINTLRIIHGEGTGRMVAFLG